MTLGAARESTGPAAATSTGVTAYGTYVPIWRLDRADAVRPWGDASAIAGTRAVAGSDEDTTSMAVEAALPCVRGSAAPDALYFATTSPAYLEKTNAATIHAALGLPSTTAAYDCGGANRSAMAAIRAGLAEAACGRRALAVGADIRSGSPGSRDERAGGDLAAALELGRGEAVIASVVGAGSATLELLDRWRRPGARHGSAWDERASERLYIDAGTAAIERALDEAGLSLGDLAWVGVAGLHQRARAAVTSKVRRAGARQIDADEEGLGTAGCAQPAYLLGRALDVAHPGDRILIVSLADGADALLLSATPALAAWRAARTPTTSRSPLSVSYERFLVWRGELGPDPARRPDPDVPAPSPMARNRKWKFALTGTRCERCRTVHLPPSRVCVACGAVDDMTDHSIRDREGTIVTFQLDYLNASPNPPSIPVVVDVDGGGRLLCELTDADPGSVGLGDRVRMSFRRISESGDGVQNYFWKACPVGRDQARGAQAHA